MTDRVMAPSSALTMASIWGWGIGAVFFLSSVMDFCPRIWTWTCEHTANHTPKLSDRFCPQSPRKDKIQGPIHRNCLCLEVSDHVLAELGIEDPPPRVRNDIDGHQAPHHSSAVGIRKVRELKWVCLSQATDKEVPKLSCRLDEKPFHEGPLMSKFCHSWECSCRECLLDLIRAPLPLMVTHPVNRDQG